MMGRRGSLYVLSAPSGAGKSTLIRHLRERVGDIGFSVSHTTREPRRGEIDGVHYHFVTKPVFEKMAAAGEFVEWASVHGNLYGTHANEIEKSLSAGKDVILDIDVQGAFQVAGKMPDALLVFVFPPDMEELERRLKGRGKDSEDVIRTRLDNALKEMRMAGGYHYVIVNDDVERAVDELALLVKAGRLRTVVRRELLDEWSRRHPE